MHIYIYTHIKLDFPDGPVVKTWSSNARDMGSSPDQGTKKTAFPTAQPKNLKKEKEKKKLKWKMKCPKIMERNRHIVIRTHGWRTEM